MELIDRVELINIVKAGQEWTVKKNENRTNKTSGE